MRFAGIDEAGYGPTLGPLTVVGVAIDGDNDAAIAAELARLGVRDSKKLHVSGNFAPLERVALPALRWLTGATLATAGEVFNALGETAAEHAALPWTAAAAHMPLPFAATALPGWRPSAITPAALCGRVIQPAAYNAFLATGRNKADLELDAVAGLLTRLHRDAPTRTTVDRLGGRRFYAELLTRALPGAVVTVAHELAPESAYACANSLGEHHVRFCVGGESVSALTALASCVAKYARELHMAGFNRWWCAAHPGLRATAGYPQDAARWLAAVGPEVLARWGKQLVRGPTLES